MSNQNIKNNSTNFETKLLITKLNSKNSPVSLVNKNKPTSNLSNGFYNVIMIMAHANTSNKQAHRSKYNSYHP